MNKATRIRSLVACAALVTLAACSSGSPPSGPTPPSPPPPATFTIGGTVSGLTGSATVTLSDTNAGSSGAIGNGAFTLPTGLSGGASYAVTATASTGESCTVTNGSGTVGSSNVTNIAVACSAVTPASYTIGGTVSGLSLGGSVELENSTDGDDLTVNANGTFTFKVSQASGQTYAVTIAVQPSGETCAITNGSGTIATADITNITVACAAVASYSIGGTVTGLSGSLTLQDNGANNLTLTANGAFTFTTAIAAGASYAVSVLTQPSGQTCTVSNGSGTVGSSNVTNVGVACVASGSGSGTGFWMPFSAAPVSGTSGGKAGLFLIASNAIASSPAPQFVTTNPVTLLGLAFQGATFGSTPPTAITPALIIYAAAGSDGNTHLYGLNLANPSNSSTAPTPTQITNLSVPASKNICSGGQTQTNGTMPSTLQIVVYVATPEAGATPGTNGYCAGVTGGTYYVINYTDSATTAPTVTTIPGGSGTLPALANDGNFSPLYQNTGILAGLLYWDSTTQDENFYSSALFTSSTTLLTGVVGTPVACVSVNSVTNGAAQYLGGSYLANVSTASGSLAYKFTPAGAADNFFAGDAASCISDPNNLYFLGTPSGGANQAIYQEPLNATSSPQTLLGGLPLASESALYSLIGSNGSVLIFDDYTVSGSGAASSTLFTVPLGVTSTNATTIGGPYAGGLVSAFLASPSAGSAGNDVLFLSESNPSTSNNVTTVSFSSQVLSSTGSAILPASSAAVWQSFGVFSTELSGYVLQIKGITDTTGSYGGATLNLMNVGSLSGAPIPLTTPAGATYVVPAGNALSTTGFYGTTIAVAEFISETTGSVFSAAVDVSQHVILPLNLTNTNVAPLL
jgi:hypothetical protein